MEQKKALNYDQRSYRRPDESQRPKGPKPLSSSSSDGIFVVGLTKKKYWTHMKTKHNQLAVDNGPAGDKLASIPPGQPEEYPKEAGSVSFDVAVAATELPSVQSDLMNLLGADDLKEDDSSLSW